MDYLKPSPKMDYLVPSLILPSRKINSPAFPQTKTRSKTSGRSRRRENVEGEFLEPVMPPGITPLSRTTGAGALI